MTKKAGLFGDGEAVRGKMEEISQAKDSVNKLTKDYSNIQARFRAFADMNRPGKVNSTMDQVGEAENKLHDGISELQSLFKQRGELKQKEADRNIGIGVGVGIPALMGIGYAEETEKNHQNQ